MDGNNHKINLSDVYYKLGELDGEVKGISKKLDNAVQDHEKRINNLESGFSNLVGKLTVIGSVAGFVGSIIFALVKYFHR